MIQIIIGRNNIAEKLTLFNSNLDHFCDFGEIRSEAEWFSRASE